MQGEDDSRKAKTVLLYQAEWGKEFRSTKAYLTQESEGDLVIRTEDPGDITKHLTCDYDYDLWITVKAEHKDHVLLALINKVFGGNSTAVWAFKDFLESNGIPCEIRPY
jgi:hypothetical protein